MKTLLLIMLLVAGFELRAQQDSAYPGGIDEVATSDRYLARSRQQRVATWFLLGSGLLLWKVGINNFTLDGFGGGGLAMIAGTAAIAGSIPLAVQGFRNKRRAKLLLNNRAVPLTHKYSYSLPSLEVRISLGK